MGAGVDGGWASDHRWTDSVAYYANLVEVE